MTTIKLRRGTSAQWATANPVLAAGEPGLDEDTRVLKVGDGATAWADLPGYLDETGLSEAVGIEVAATGARSYATSQGVYLPAPLAGSKWRRKRAAVLAGDGRAHIAVLGDSQSFGAAATGNSAPKNESSWPGRLISMLKQRGLYGGGWAFANADVLSNPSWDDRWTFAGTVTAPTGTGGSGAFGFHRSGTFRIASGSSANYVEFTAEMDHFQVMTAQGASGLYSITIDGVSAGTVGNGSGTGTIAKVTDTDASAYAPSQEVTVPIDCTTLDVHTVRITAPTSASQDTFLLGIKPIISGDGKIEVSNPSYNGKSLLSLWAASGSHNDETNGLYGLPLIDALKADLLVVALGINDWQFNAPAQTLASAQANVATLIARQRASGPAGTGAVRANGDAMLLWNPEPLNSLGASPQTWAEWRDGWYDSADAAGVPLLDLGMRFGGYASGTAAGLFADTIHRNDTGSLDELAAIHEAIMHRV